ncbi:MAG TPA: molybdopterin cofactor-binding domain-containing protein, partial [Vicinamibacterales bacterium]|nr:molybdopterin cofactor-binding domain-containing protein [Vicinamibacterales bacterium]
MGKWTRRAFIGAGSLVGGGFVLGVGGLAFAPNRLTVKGQPNSEGGQLNTWIVIAPDNTITVLVPHCEMGQGTQTALTMMAAEEMNADWSRVRVKEAPALDAYANAYIIRAFIGDGIPAPLARGFDYGTYRLASWFGTQMTGGSLSVRSTGHYGMRVAGAAAREMLVAAAAARFNVKAAECTSLNSRVMHSSGVEATFGELAAEAAKMAVPAHPATKEPSTYTIRRTPRPRFDIPSKVNGSAIYGIDFSVPGMKYAAIEIAPVSGGKLVSVDSAAAEHMPGVLKVVHLDEAVAVVADSYWQARKAAEALKPEWSDAGHGSVTTASIFSAFDRSLGAPPEMPKEAATVITADYTVPFLAHATMEPMVCTAKVDGDRCDVWAGVQDPLNARDAASKALKM